MQVDRIKSDLHSGVKLDTHSWLTSWLKGRLASFCRKSHVLNLLCWIYKTFIYHQTKGHNPNSSMNFRMNPDCSKCSCSGSLQASFLNVTKRRERYTFFITTCCADRWWHNVLHLHLSKGSETLAPGKSRVQKTRILFPLQLLVDTAAQHQLEDSKTTCMSRTWSSLIASIPAHPHAICSLAD